MLRGDNILNSCFQYRIKDSDGTNLFVLKFYDKILDLLGREASHIVGTRINEVIGSKHHNNSFNKRVSMASNHGLTRIELSLCKEALLRYKPFYPSIKTLWHDKIKTAL